MPDPLTSPGISRSHAIPSSAVISGATPRISGYTSESSPVLYALTMQK